MRVHAPLGVSPLTYTLGVPAEVQTVATRCKAGIGQTAPNPAKCKFSNFSLSVGEYQTDLLRFGASDSEVQAALEGLATVDNVIVERSGGTGKASYYFGYVYTVTFWGTYQERGVPQIEATSFDNLNGFLPAGSTTVVDSAGTKTEVLNQTFSTHVHTVHSGVALGDHSQQYVALKEGTDYLVRLSAINGRGFGDVSTFSASTPTTGVVPDAPRALTLGGYYSSDSLYVDWKPPHCDGGATITMYKVEWDSSSSFNGASGDYGSDELAVVPEVQDLLTYFRSDDSVAKRGGTFTLMWGGQTTEKLKYDISAHDLEIAVAGLTGVFDVNTNPIHVTRQAVARGYRWLITYTGVYGDVGPLAVDGDMLTGDDARITTSEVVKELERYLPRRLHIRSADNQYLRPLETRWHLQAQLRGQGNRGHRCDGKRAELHGKARGHHYNPHDECQSRNGGCID